MKTLQYTVGEDAFGETVGMLLEQRLHLSKQAIAKLRHYEKGVLINGRCVSVRRIVHVGDVLEVLFDPTEEMTYAPEKADLDIIFEDEDIVVVNKPAGLAMSPTETILHHTLANGLAYHYKQNREAASFYPITQLDAESSGLVLIAKNAYVHSRMDMSKISKRYRALVSGDLLRNSFIEAPIAVDPDNEKHRCIADHGKYARTEYEVIQRYRSFTEVEVYLTTGRTHQIRVHFSHIGHPILGDSIYHGDCEEWKNPALCAIVLDMEHPITGEKMHFDVEAPSLWERYTEMAKEQLQNI